jgi:hypothetical protein
MSPIRLALVLCALFLATAWFAPKASGESASADTVTVSGIVELADEDEAGTVTAVFLSTPEEDYYVEPSGPGRQLLERVGDRVTVIGTMHEDELFGPTLRVAQIQSSEDED